MLRLPSALLSRPKRLHESQADRQARLRELFVAYKRQDEFKALSYRQLEAALWGAFPTHAFSELIWRYSNAADHTEALFALARWCASEGRYQDCVDFLDEIVPGDDPAHERQRGILKIFSLAQLGETKAAAHCAKLYASSGSEEDLLACAIAAPGIERLRLLNKIFDHAGVSRIICNNTPRLEYITSISKYFLPDETLTVLMPAYNCSAVLPVAIRSVLNQTWQNLEIIIIDDASTDDTLATARAFAAVDTRIKILKHERNVGAYAARNTGLRAATGEFITVHDADDWSHPEKFALQIEALKDKQICTTAGVRLTEDLQPIVKANNSAILIENMSSLMGRTADFRRLGGWDEVRAGADSEFYERFRLAYQTGPNLIRPKVPLTLIRSSASSLTQHKSTGLKTINYGCRREYRESYRAWHLSSPDMRIQGRAPFAAPRLLTRRTVEQYDVVAVMDFSSVDDDFVSEVEYYVEEGKQVGVVNEPTPATANKTATARVKTLLVNSGVDILVSGDAANAAMIIYADSKTTFFPENRPTLHGLIVSRGNRARTNWKREV